MCRSLLPLALAVTVSALAACTDVFAPEMIAGAQRFEPHDDYALWWAQIESCSGKEAPLDRVRWYQVPDVNEFEYRGELYAGYWWPTHDIVLTEWATWDRFTVRHEMLHDLLKTGSHPLEYFETRCGALVGQ
jgi:hypothetical protein